MIPPEVALMYAQAYGIDVADVPAAVTETEESMVLGHPCPREGCRGRLVHVPELDGIDDVGTVTYLCNNDYCTVVGHDLDYEEEQESAA